MTPGEVLDHPDLDGFMLGPDETNVEENGAEAVHYRLVGNGVHGEAAGVFFDASTADVWFDRGPGEAKLSAIDDGSEVIAWGRDDVNVR